METQEMVDYCRRNWMKEGGRGGVEGRGRKKGGREMRRGGKVRRGEEVGEVEK